MILDLTRDELTLVVHSLRMAADELYMQAAREWGTANEMRLNTDCVARRQLAARLERPLFEVAS